MTDQAYDEREDEQESRREEGRQAEVRDEDESKYGRTPEREGENED